MPGGGTTWIRVALIALGALLGLALVASGNVLIGGLLLVMAAMRGVMTFRFHQQREWRQGPRRQGVHRHRRQGAASQGLGDIDR